MFDTALPTTTTTYCLFLKYKWASKQGSADIEDNFPSERETNKNKKRDYTKGRGEIFKKSLTSSERKEISKTITNYVQKKKKKQ